MSDSGELVEQVAIEPHFLYHEDGSVNYGAVETYLEEQRPLTNNTSALDRVAVGITSLTINFDTEDEPCVVPSKEKDPIDYAITDYLGYLLVKSFEPDWRTGSLSEALDDDPNCTLSMSNEIESYFGDMKEHQSMRYGHIKKLHAALSESPNDVTGVRCIVAIPVAGHQEHQNIYRTLQQFDGQTIGSDTFEIALYLNLPAGEGDRDQQLYDDVLRTIAEIERFNANYPHLTVRYCTNAYRGEAPTIGKIRSDLWDTIAYDVRERGRRDDVLVVSADADIVHLNADYLEGLYQTWQTTGADVVTANLVWQTAPGLPYDATVNRVLRYQAFLDMLRDNHSAYTHTADANTAVSLAAYYAVGGYDRDNKLGEMFSLVYRIRHFRQVDDTARLVVAKSSQSYLKSHSRRLVKAMALGRGPYEAWNQKLIAFGADDELRTAEMDSAAAEAQAVQHWQKWVKQTTPHYTRDVPMAKKRRVLKEARRILKFDDLYK